MACLDRNEISFSDQPYCSEHSTKSSTGNEKEKATEKILCSRCEKDFSSHFAYNRHVAKCKSENKTCIVCNCVFNTRDELRDHQTKDISHIGKVFLCQEKDCYGAFTTKKGLDYHVRTHTARVFNCDACGQVFDSHEFFSAHKKTDEHKKNAKQTECQGCECKFHGKYEAKRHFDSSCYFNPERNVKCTVCNVVTGKAKNFLEHLKEEHSCPNKYLCTRCLIHFPTNSGLNSHLKSCKK